MEYVRYTENLRQVLVRRGYRYLQWGRRLPENLLEAGERHGAPAFELLLHREKKYGRRMPSIYGIDTQKAMDEAALDGVHFFVRLPY